MLNNFKTFDGSKTKFNKGILLNNDKNLISINDNNKKMVEYYDIETQKLIHSYNNDKPLLDITPCEKRGTIFEGNTIYGNSNNE